AEQLRLGDQRTPLPRRATALRTLARASSLSTDWEQRPNATNHRRLLALCTPLSSPRKMQRIRFDGSFSPLAALIYVAAIGPAIITLEPFLMAADQNRALRLAFA